MRSVRKCTIEKIERKKNELHFLKRNVMKQFFEKKSKMKKHERDTGGTSAGATVRQSLSKTTHYKKNNDLTKVEEQDDHIKSQLPHAQAIIFTQSSTHLRASSTSSSPLHLSLPTSSWTSIPWAYHPCMLSTRFRWPTS